MSNLNKIMAVLLLIALVPLPYAYYQLLRIVVTVAAAIYAYMFYDESNPKGHSIWFYCTHLESYISNLYG